MVLDLVDALDFFGARIGDSNAAVEFLLTLTYTYLSTAVLSTAPPCFR